VTRYWEPRLQMWNIQILPGELYVTSDAEVISTVLGSCVSACVRDPVRGVGGMNHFMLPHAPRGMSDTGASARYGLYALECLLNDLMRRGAHRDRFEVKVFGGGRVLQGTTDIGKGNIDFVRTFFRDEGLPIVAEDVGGRCARRLRYWPLTGVVKLLQMPMDHTVAVEERRRAKTIPPVTEAGAGSVELF
jgi:chemotaxis protein CheD